LLLQPDELDRNGETTLRDRRARHLLDIIRVTPGKRLRSGRLGLDRGSAEILATTPESVTIRYAVADHQPAPMRRVLCLAISRPKVLSRCLQHASALGYRRIALFRSFRVEKSHLLSHKLKSVDIRRHLLLGLEQGGHVHLPEVLLFERFRPFVEDRLGSVSVGARFVAHPWPLSDVEPSANVGSNCDEDPTPTLQRAISSPDADQLQTEGFTLVLGPEGGFIPFEVELLVRHGCRVLATDAGLLRVESALSYFTGQLDVIGQRM